MYKNWRAFYLKMSPLAGSNILDIDRLAGSNNIYVLEYCGAR
jgi:hypothetical protein